MAIFAGEDRFARSWWCAYTLNWYHSSSRGSSNSTLAGAWRSKTKEEKKKRERRDPRRKVISIRYLSRERSSMDLLLVQLKGRLKLAPQRERRESAHRRPSNKSRERKLIITNER